MRVTVIKPNGDVVYDSYEKDKSKLKNHIERKEIQRALKKGNGYDVRRTSQTTGVSYFYSATAYPDFIVRTALPYNVNLTNSLKTDRHYLWFTGFITLVLIFIFYKFTQKLGVSIKQLREFAQRADRNEPIEIALESATSQNELGEISHHIIEIYKRLHETKEALYIERETNYSLANFTRGTWHIYEREKGDISE